VDCPVPVEEADIEVVDGSELEEAAGVDEMTPQVPY